MESQASFVVGLGASAGGLEALETFFDHAPSDSGGAFVVVMHLSRDFKSMLDELLSRHTKMPVRAAHDGDRLEANTVYVIQPGTTLEVSGAHLRVANRPVVDPAGSATTIDGLFRSIATEWKERGGAVVLSGSGSDGAQGVGAIHKSGGFACAQSPETAKFDSMPISAISTNAIRAVEAPELLAQTVVDGVLLPQTGVVPRAASDQDTALGKILKAVMGVTNLDASKYKHSTFERRLRRRMMDLKIGSLADYANRIADDPIEAQKLSEALLIGVTEFFRDHDVFHNIEHQVVPELINRAQQDSRPIRIWVPGCATGEEAYSIAILFTEALQDVPQKVEFQIFATDVQREHLAEAGRGEYSEERLAGLSAERRQKFFKPIEGTKRWVIDPDIRKSIVMAPHDILTDPPFTRLDLISCRNLLIYFSVEAQQKILAGFAFGLSEKGFLVLGSSETIGGHRDSFEFIDARNRVFRRTALRRAAVRHLAPMDPQAREAALHGGHRRSQRLRENVLQPAYAALLKDYAPASLLVSTERELLHSFGSAREFLRPPEGVAHLDAADMVDSALRTPMIAGLERAAKDKTAVTFSRIELDEFPVSGRVVDLTVRPLLTGEQSTAQFLLVIIDDTRYITREAAAAATTVVSADALAGDRIQELEAELERTREALQSTIEEIETTNEELQSSNEELMSSNEELQSTNEELSSVNEELYSVNSEYHRQNDELSQLSSDFDLLLQSTEIGVVFLDNALNISRFTTFAGKLFGLEESDLGRPIMTFRSPFVDADPGTLLSQAVQTRQVVEAEARTENGVAWLIRAVSSHNRQGSVLTVISIGRLRDAEAESRRTTAMLESLRATTSAIYVELTGNGGHLLRELGWFETTGERTRPLPRPAAWTSLHEGERDHFEATLRDDALEAIDGVYRVWVHAQKEYRHYRFVGVKNLRENERQSCWHITAVDVDRIVRSEREAQKREVIFNGLLQASSSLLSFVDNDQRYVYVNDQYEHVLKKAKDKIIGKKIDEVLPQEMSELVQPSIEAALSGERCEQFIDNELANGLSQRYSITYQPVRNGGGDIIGLALDARDVSKHYRRADDIEHTTQLLGKAVRTSSCPALIVDVATCVVEFANVSALRALGLRVEHGLPAGTHLSRLTPEWGDLSWKTWFDEIVPGQDAIRTDVSVFDEQQKTKISDVMVTVFGDMEKKKAMIRVIDNIERTVALTDLRNRSKELAISNRDLEQFASIVAHDLRAPLRHIHHFVNFMSEDLDGIDVEKAREHLNVISNSAHTLTGMIEALLDYARLGRTARTFTHVDLKVCVEKAQMLLQNEISAVDAVVQVNDLTIVYGDADLLTRLFQNLISNSLKYHRKNVVPHIKILSESEHGFVRISFIDNGIGIDSKYEKQVFKLFQRLHGEDEYPGLGVGLSTCRRICELHGGDIELNVVHREGTRMDILLPAVEQ